MSDPLLIALGVGVGTLGLGFALAAYAAARPPPPARSLTTERRFRQALRSPEALEAGIDSHVVAAGIVTLDDLVSDGCGLASSYVLMGKTIEAARALAVQDMAARIRLTHGREMAQVFRDRMTAMPVLLLLTPAAHVAAADNVERMSHHGR